MGIRDIRSLSFTSRQVGYISGFVVALALVLMPALAGAEQVTQRSIELSSSSEAAQNVSYALNFTAPNAADALVIDFCAESPTVGNPTCTTPAGFTAASAVVAAETPGFTATAVDANTVRIVGDVIAGANTIQLNSINNPTVSGAFYARIVTYETAALAADHAITADTPGVLDTGGLAISITPTIGVSGAVLESLTFCVSSQAINPNCGLQPDSAPVVELGETVGDTKALIATALSEGSIWTQLSTNAATGAVVRVKSDALNCGGLMRAGAPTACDIGPALDDGVAVGQARFGIKTADAIDAPSATDATGVIRPYDGSLYNTSTFALNYVAGNASGVTSTFGDPFLDTNNLPVNNRNMQITFGASVGNNTPAGLYSADLSLIATGKF